MNPLDPDNNPIYGIRKEANRDCKQTSPILQMARRFSIVITWHAGARFRVWSRQYRRHIRRQSWEMRQFFLPSTLLRDEITRAFHGLCVSRAPRDFCWHRKYVISVADRH